MSEKKRLWIPRSAADGHTLGRDALLSLDAKIKPDFRRAVSAGILAVICLAVGNNLGGVDRHNHWRYLVIGLTVAFGLLGIGAVRSAAREAFRISNIRGGPSTASALRLIISIVGYGLVALGLLQLLDVDLRSLLVGGAVTGVIIGIAAQQSLANFFAGLVLLFARPYIPGQRVKVYSGGMGGPFEGTIIAAGLLYTTMITEDGPINLPNAGLLASAVGPAPEPTDDDPAENPDANPDPSPDPRTDASPAD
ncbi:mechanosensitive ion channel domain-containing protein [Jatrophihabitans sp. DSM 45814]